MSKMECDFVALPQPPINVKGFIKKLNDDFEHREILKIEKVTNYMIAIFYECRDPYDEVFKSRNRLEKI